MPQPSQDPKKSRRFDNTAKCPACGWRLDPTAYRCTNCKIYFCSKCRVRLAEHEAQFQCADQTCPCYGKLVCAACTVMVQQSRVVRPYSPPRVEGNNWGLIVIIAVFFAALCAWLDDLSTSPAQRLTLAVTTFGFGAAALSWPGLTWFKRHIPAIPERMAVDEHRSCLTCRHPVKVLHDVRSR